MVRRRLPGVRSRGFSDQPADAGTCRTMAQTKPVSSRTIAVATTMAGLAAWVRVLRNGLADRFAPRYSCGATNRVSGRLPILIAAQSAEPKPVIVVREERLTD